ncbi:MASE4 domain-containing protein, partial [Acinetobacter baumannii]
KTVIIIQQPIDGRLTRSVIQNDTAIYYFFRQVTLCLLIYMAMVIKIFEQNELCKEWHKKFSFYISIIFIIGLPI